MAPLPSSPPPPIPPPVPVETHPNRAGGLKPPPVQQQQRLVPDPSRLAPKDAYYTAGAPSFPIPRLRPPSTNYEGSLRGLNVNGNIATRAAVAALRPPPAVPDAGAKQKDTSRKTLGAGSQRRRKGAWKKLLWVKQTYPDNYTDIETFLDHLQRNPRVRPYDFWPLVADSTVIVQHVCSVVIFICCFVGIFQNRVSPVSVVCWGSVGTVIGWILWDSWIWRNEQADEEQEDGEEEEEEGEGEAQGSKASHHHHHHAADSAVEADDGFSSGSASASGSVHQAALSESTAADGQQQRPSVHGLGLHMSGAESVPSLRRRASTGFSADSDSHVQSHTASSPFEPLAAAAAATTTATKTPPHGFVPYPSTSPATPPNRPQGPQPPPQRLSSRYRQRLTTIKSGFLIYLSLLGLSPILKSLTKSTASDSIWAMSCWLIITNIFSFDYGSGGGDATTFPASLSTNAAVMASTVLASRLPSTTHVFSLMLFSIEVFGLFPIFRRQLRGFSWSGHLVLTGALVVAAGAGVGITVRGGWAAAVVGALLGSLMSALAMGGCSWWLISLQKYKNVVIGPWDPARPIIRRQWD